MLRNVYLEGAMGDVFASEFELDVNTFQEAFKCIACNFDGFRKYMLECDEAGIGFICEVAGEYIEDENHLLLPIKEGDITISPVPAGSKSAGAKILMGIAIIALAVYAPVLLSSIAVEGAFVGTALTLQTAAIGLGVSLALTGVQQLMAPDPATDNQSATPSYLFNGSEQNIVEGDPVPLLYGELRVPGRPISFEILNQQFVGGASLVTRPSSLSHRGQV